MTTNGTTGVGGAASTNPDQSPLPDRMKEMGSDAFLNLLVTQLQHQDPTNPVDDSEFIAQLATFSQVEKLTEIADGITAIKHVLVPETAESTDGGE